MILSADRQSYLIHLIVDSLEKRGLLYYKDRERVHLLARGIMNQCIKMSTEMDQKIRDKIQSLKRSVSENSSEWQVLYSNYLEDEMIRKGLVPTKER